MLYPTTTPTSMPSITAPCHCPVFFTTHLSSVLHHCSCTPPSLVIRLNVKVRKPGEFPFWGGTTNRLMLLFSFFFHSYYLFSWFLYFSPAQINFHLGYFTLMASGFSQFISRIGLPVSLPFPRLSHLQVISESRHFDDWKRSARERFCEVKL